MSIKRSCWIILRVQVLVLAAFGVGLGLCVIARAPRSKVSEIFLATPNQSHGRSESIDAIEISPDSRVLVTLDEAGGVTLWDASNGSIIRTMSNTKDAETVGPNIRLMALSPDGQKVAVARASQFKLDNPSLVDVWSLKSGALLGSYTANDCYVGEPEPTKVRALRFSANSDRIILAGHFEPESKDLLLSWKLSSDGPACYYLAELGTIDDPALRTALSTRRTANGADIRAAVAHSSRIDVWDFHFVEGEHYKIRDPYKITISYDQDLAFIESLAVSPQGDIVIVGFCRRSDQSHSVEGWKLDKDGGGHLLERLDKRRQPTFSPDGSLLLLAGGTSIELRQMEGRGLGRRIANHYKWGDPMAISPNNQWLAVVTDGGAKYWADNGVELFDIRTGLLNRTFDITRSLGAVTSVAFSVDGSLLASGGENGVAIWDPATGGRLRKLDAGLVTSLAFSPKARILVTGHRSSRMKVWDITDGRMMRELHTYLERRITEERAVPSDYINRWNPSFAFSPDGRLLASSVTYGQYREELVSIWDTDRWKLVRTLRGSHKDFINQLAFSPDGRWLASASADGTIGVWDITKGSAREFLWNLGVIRAGDPFPFVPGHRPSSVMSVAFSHSGKILVAGTKELASLYDVDTGRWLGASNGGSRSMASSPDGNTVAFATDGGRLELVTSKFPSVDRAILPILPSEFGLRALGGRVNAYQIAFAPNGAILASASLDGVVQLWDVVSGHLMMNLVDLPGSEWLAFSPTRLWYRGSERAETWASVRMEGLLLPVFPLSRFRESLRFDHRAASSSAAWPDVYPAKMLFVQLALNRFYGMWQLALLGGFVVLPYLFVALFALSREQTSA